MQLPRGNPKLLDGKRFGKLVVIRFDHVGKHYKRYHLCQCDCGNKCLVETAKLTTGHTKSCGCLKNKAYHWVHGHRHTRQYRIWANMKTRCYNRRDPHYPRWGGRGIEICDEWLNDFEAFYTWANAHGYQDNLSIDRIDNDGNYEPNNCRWANDITQNNNKRNTKKVIN